MAELSALSLGNNFQIVYGVGECLGTHLLSAMDERDSWLLNAQRMADIVHVSYLLSALSGCGYWNDGSIGEEQQLLVLRNLSHGHMGQHMALAQNALFLVQDGSKQHIGIDESFHQDVGLSTFAQCYRLACTLFFVVTVDIDGLNEPHLLAFFHCVAGAGIIGAYHGNAFLVSSLLQEDYHVVKCPDRFHRLFVM